MNDLKSNTAHSGARDVARELEKRTPADERYGKAQKAYMVHAIAEQKREIERLREDSAQAYQAVGFLAHCLGYWEMSEDDPRQMQITKLLDNLTAASEGNPRPHDDLIPFGWKV